MKTYTLLYRASDHQFGVHARQRYFSNSKTEISAVCFMSLYQEIKKYKNVKIKILADNLSNELFNFFNHFKNVEIIKLDDNTELFNGSKPHFTKNGLRRSLQNLVTEIENCDTDFVWIQEDDYLFDHKLINNIFEIHNNSSLSTVENLILYLCDYRDKYSSKPKSWKLFCEHDIWWREIPSTTFSFIAETDFLKSKKHKFNQMFEERKYKNFDSFLSSEIFNDAFLISPIPSINAHLDENVKLPAFTDWKKIWTENYKKFVLFKDQYE